LIEGFPKKRAASRGTMTSQAKISSCELKIVNVAKGKPSFDNGGSGRGGGQGKKTAQQSHENEVNCQQIVAVIKRRGKKEKMGAWPRNSKKNRRADLKSKKGCRAGNEKSSLPAKRLLNLRTWEDRNRKQQPTRDQGGYSRETKKVVTQRGETA